MTDNEKNYDKLIEVKMINQQEYEQIKARCQELPRPKGNYLVDDYITNLFLTVLDFQLRGEIVERAVNFFKEKYGNKIKTLQDLKEILSKKPDTREGNTEIAQDLWGNRYWNRVALLRKFVKFLEDNKVTDQNSLKEWAKKSNYKRDFEGKIKGMNYAIYQWLIMRVGIETIKPDIHIKKFITSIIGREIDDSEIVRVLEKIAKNLGVKAYELDWSIWEYQRNIKQKTDLQKRK
jgi:hypothetical protein